MPSVPQKHRFCIAERLLEAALEALLDNRSFDFYWIDQRDLRPEHVLRGGRIRGGAIIDFAEQLERELGVSA